MRLELAWWAQAEQIAVTGRLDAGRAVTLRHPVCAARQARVMGEFPTQGDNALISLAWLEAAARRPAYDAGGQVHAGLDVAGPARDETVLVVREGSSILGLQSWSKADPRGEVVAALAPWRSRLETVNVDSAGIGYYLGKHLEDLDYPVRLVNVGQSSSDGEKYANKKAEFFCETTRPGLQTAHGCR